MIYLRYVPICAPKIANQTKKTKLYFCKVFFLVLETRWRDICSVLVLIAIWDQINDKTSVGQKKVIRTNEQEQ